MLQDQASTPWSNLDEQGAGLTVDCFMTTLMSQAGNALRRTLTVSYASQFGLTVSEWRLLSLIGHAQRLAFSDLVVQSTSDKALVSRTLKPMEARGLVELQPEGNTPRKKLYCQITEQGMALYQQAMPAAQAAQAAAIRSLSRQERDIMFRALHRIHAYCEELEAGR